MRYWTELIQVNNFYDFVGVSSEDFASILLQGSGTYSVEAAIQTLVPRSSDARVSK